MTYETLEMRRLKARLKYLHNLERPINTAVNKWQNFLYWLTCLIVAILEIWMIILLIKG